MYDTVAVRDRERGGDLIEQSRGLRQRPGAVLFERSLHAPTAHPAHDEIGIVWLTPEIVQWNDMQMLKPCNDLRFGFEAPDEIWVVGVLRVDNFDRHFTINDRLIGTVNTTLTAAS